MVMRMCTDVLDDGRYIEEGAALVGRKRRSKLVVNEGD